jgi:hypothetical protein
MRHGSEPLKALAEFAAKATQVLQLLLGLDSLGQHSGVDLVAE